MTRHGYKMTEIGEIPTEWEVLAFEEAFNKQESKQSKIPASKFKNKGKFPIIDQGMDLISGYTDNDELLYNGNLPLIIFGDHTLCVKYVDFQFAVGADGTKLLIPNNQRFSPRFLFFTILGKNLKSEGYKRHFSKLRKQFFQCPGINEQQKIAEILSTADETIQKVNEEITLTEKLKKGLMQTLLTKGIGHTKFKMTEIGEIPEEWPHRPFSEVLQIRKRNNEGKSEEIYTIPMELIPENGIYCGYMPLNKKGVVPPTYCESGDILLPKITPSVENGKQGMVPPIPSGYAFATSEVYALVTNDSLTNIFTFYLLKFSLFRKPLIDSMVGTTGRQRVPKDSLFSLSFPVPPIQEQQKITEILTTVDHKLELLRNKKTHLEKLKKGLMEDLLTGKVRVKINTSKGEN